MSDNPLDRIPGLDRVSIRAVVVMEGEDPAPLLAAAGIVDPVAVPVVFGENAPDRSFGDGLTPNLTAVVEFDQQADGAAVEPDSDNGATVGSEAASGRQVNAAGSDAGAEPRSRPATIIRPAAAGASCSTA